MRCGDHIRLGEQGMLRLKMLRLKYIQARASDPTGLQGVEQRVMVD